VLTGISVLVPSFLASSRDSILAVEREWSRIDAGNGVVNQES